MTQYTGIDRCQIGMIGLGVMGRNLLLNMADHGFTVAGYDQDTNKVESLLKESSERTVYGASTTVESIKLLRRPRAIMLLVPAGKPVDLALNELMPYLEHGDLIIDAGNSHFTDTDDRIQRLESEGLQFLGVGISGGEEGARRGPSMMPGGSKDAYERVRPILEAVAAKVQDEPCVTYLGKGSVGHFVKMVHNGIEYGLMQVIAEAYDLMKQGLGLKNETIKEVFSAWKKGELSGFLIDITADIFGQIDPDTGEWLLDKIVGVAAQKGTGLWTSQSAMALQVPAPTIDLAVSMRDLSVLVAERARASECYPLMLQPIKTECSEFLKQLEAAVLVGMAMVYAQGMAILAAASQQYGYQIDLEAVARIWRGGCIIRANFLEDIRSAYHAHPQLPNLLLDQDVSKKINLHQDSLRKIVSQASLAGIPVPALMSSLGYFDAYRHGWQPANLIQAQRDYFGSHTYQRIDQTGTFHTKWNKGGAK